MHTDTRYGTFEEAVSDHTPEVIAIARRLRAVIESVHPDALELPWVEQGDVGYGIGPKKMSEHYAYIGPYRTYVNLGFFHGTALPDPEGLLEGTGKKLRHVKVRSIGDRRAPGAPAAHRGGRRGAATGPRARIRLPRSFRCLSLRLRTRRSERSAGWVGRP